MVWCWRRSLLCFRQAPAKGGAAKGGLVAKVGAAVKAGVAVKAGGAAKGGGATKGGAAKAPVDPKVRYKCNRD